MKHPHHDMIIEWVKDTTRVVQVSDPRFADKCWIDASDPTWQGDLEYRFKPVPKPDVVQELVCTMTGVHVQPSTTRGKDNQRNERTTMTHNIKSAELAAIEFAIRAEEGLEFLRAWHEGSFDAIRREWPDAPEAVFIGADPMHKPQRDAITAIKEHLNVK